VNKSAYVVAAVIALIAPSGVAAQDKPVELKLSHWVPPSHPLHKAMEDWGASIEKDSHGTITYKVFPAQQLGKAFDHYDMARDGIADVTYVNPGYQPGRFPIIAAGELPFMVTNGNGGSAALDAWYRNHAAKEMKDVKFCLAFVHDPGGIHSVSKKVMVPADIEGMKIRPAQGTIAEFVTELGGTNVQASAPEVREMLDRGVAGAVTFPWGSVILFGLDKVTRYHLDVPLYTTTFVWIMNRAKYDAMSPAQRQVMDDHCTTEWAERVAAPWADFEYAGRDRIRAEPGQQVYTLSADQLSEWRKAAEPLRATWADRARRSGIDAGAALKEFEGTIARYNAAF
jgi:TRAP-type C4-dicarboxylate transport system substrate-binding protein